MTTELSTKRVQLLKEILPGLKRLGAIGDAGFAKLVAQRPDAVYVLGGALTTHLRPRFAELAAQKRLPMIPGANSGGLFTYGSSLANGLRRSAQMVDKILRGAKPADIPVEQPTVFKLVVNVKAAKALGLTVPPSVLLRANQVIQ